MNVVEEETFLYGGLLAVVAGSRFKATNKYDGHQLPFRWEFWTEDEPIRRVATIELRACDILNMNEKALIESWSACAPDLCIY